MKKILSAITVLFVSITLLGCSPTPANNSTDITENDIPKATPTGLIKGFGISPSGFPTTFDNLVNYFEEVSNFGNGGVFFNGSWRNDTLGGTDSGQIPETAILVSEQAEIFRFTPIVDFGWRSEQSIHLNVPGNSTNDWSNEEAKGLFLNMVLEYAKTYHPPYLFLANENSFYFEQNPEDYYRFVEFYNLAYDAIKDVSPETQVGVVFNYEHLAGTGNFNRWTTSQWKALDAHDLERLDVIGITLYPWLGYGTVEEVPNNYMDELFERIGDIPVAITETGWPGFYLDETILAWEASNEAQIEFVDKLEIMLAGRNIVIANWLFLYPPVDLADKNLWITFANLSLYDLENNRLPIYEKWQEFSIK
ncbi:MAG: hypothetical protein HON98_08140 [Chloroflexi bacterium]|jgi:hypothetical protein|nr:hypothetical protein [Chloroflexota bacterium]MBT3669915.1 hypothetical protein [Chloroflexota bacterium]MBT4001801.1 hypothetical protein [Chloroflexota bacterium]MBT4304817.1 hypothetical protein [Chloroflexota bacterium]MBT4534682.1 hypothetical protein [Chloroflexota bacterium]